MEKKAGIIIPAKERPSTLNKCLDSVLSLSCRNYEVVVVDDGLEEPALKVLDDFQQRIKIIKSNSKGPSYARNLAAKSTDAEFLAFTDADCIVDNNWLAELLKGFGQFPDAVACGGSQRLPDDAAPFEKKVFLFMRRAGFITDYMRETKDAAIVEVNHNASCCVMYKREVFLKEGGFLEGLWPGEDVELDYRLRKKGYKLVFNPQAVVYHYRPKNVKAFLRMMYRYGKAQGFLVRRYGMFRKIHILPFLSALLLVISIPLSFSFFIKAFFTVILLLFILYFNFDIFLMFLCVSGFLCWIGGFYTALILGKNSQ